MEQEAADDSLKASTRLLCASAEGCAGAQPHPSVHTLPRLPVPRERRGENAQETTWCGPFDPCQEKLANLGHKGVR